MNKNKHRLSVILLSTKLYLVFLRNVSKQLTNSPQTSGYRPADSVEDAVRLPDNSHRIEEDRCSNSADITGMLPHCRFTQSELLTCDLSEVELWAEKSRHCKCGKPFPVITTGPEFRIGCWSHCAVFCLVY